jgi:hypothetical protein
VLLRLSLEVVVEVEEEEEEEEEQEAESRNRITGKRYLQHNTFFSYYKFRLLQSIHRVLFALNYM